MLARLILLAAIAGGAYWYWSGPYQEKINPSYESTLKQNNENMALCKRTAAYQRGATGSGLSAERAEAKCAEEYKVYQLEGQWHRYDMTRPDQ